MRLNRDIEDVMSWPYAKINDWIAYLAWVERK